MSLLLLQKRMRDHLLSGSPSIVSLLRGNEASGLAVYHHAYRAQLIASLSDTYEKVWAWLGDDAFEAAASRHVEANPPRSWTLSDYGQAFVQTLADLYPADPEVAELAWLDWSLRRAFDGPDATPVDPGALEDVNWDAAVFDFVPTLRLGVLTTNAAAIWSALAEDETPPAAQSLATPAGMRVWRRDLSSQFRSISLDELRALERALAGATFPEICDCATEDSSPERAHEVAGQMLGQWLLDGIVRRIGW